tara:strand:+ start:233 stop:493 length:261 start_codon:yes stop_codon:yes gene_type:complete
MIEKYILNDFDLLKYEILLLKNNIRHKINVKESKEKLDYIWFNMGFIPDEKYIRGLMYEEYQERPEKERLVPAIPSEIATGKYTKY